MLTRLINAGRHSLFVTSCLLLIAMPSICVAGPSIVKVEQRDNKYQLTVDGKPFFIKGVGGAGDKEIASRLGANSFRTWGIDDNTKEQLDEAQRLGMKVTLGIWLGHERHGFNYNNADQVAEQLERVKAAVLKYKDHPALLMWAAGNEMEGFKNGDNAAIWSAINNIAITIKRLDPNHPVMCVTAEVGGDRVKNLHRLCPDVDVMGINSYAGVGSLVKRYKEAGGSKPIVLTEFGPPGTWEVQKNAWGAVPEPTSTEKGKWYRIAYQQTVEHSNLCLGSYAFTWGNKQEATATWFGMLLPDGERLEACDVMQELWSGSKPSNRVPQIERLTVSGPDQADGGGTIRAVLSASDPENDKLRVVWTLSRETAEYRVGCDAEEAPPTFPEAIITSTNRAVELRMPKEGGGYRLFATVRDGNGGAATASRPLFVRGPAPKIQAKAATLPLFVVGEDPRKGPYIPSGWMGHHSAIKYDENSPENPKSGQTCAKVEYRATDHFAGIVWQDPSNDWGDLPGGRNLTGARKLVWWARGETGGEVVKFCFGVLGADKKFPDSGQGEVTVTLTNEWKEYTINLNGKDLSCIKTGFVWVVGGQGKPVVFYLDDVRYE